MAGLQLIRIEDVFVGTESIEGTDPTLTAANGVQLLGNATLGVGAEADNARPDLQNQLLDEAAPIPPGAKWAELSLRGHVRGLGSAYTTSTTPELHAILQGAGLLASFASSTWTYDTASTSLKSLTAYCFHGLTDGTFVKHVLTAGRLSSFSIRYMAGKAVEWNATLRGIYNSPSSATNLTPTYSTVVPPTFVGTGSWSLGSVSPVLREASISFNNTLRPRLSGNAADGLQGYQITQRSVGFTARFEAAQIADFDAYTTWKNATAQALAISLGTGSNNKLTVAADKAVISSAPVYQDDSGMWLWSLTGTCHPEGTNRCKLTFGA